MRVFGQQDVVEADHRHVLRHAATGGGQRAHRADGDDVGGGDHAVERQSGGDRLGHAGFGVGAAETGAHQPFGRGLQPGIAQRLAIAVVAVRDFRQAFVAEEDDALAAAFGQVRGGELAAEAVVRAHHRVFLVRQPRAPDRERDAGARRLVDRGVLEALADEDHAVAAARLLQAPHPAVLVHRDLRQQHVVAAVGEGVGEVRQHRHHERVDQVRLALVHQRHPDRDHPGLPRAQAAGDRIDRVARLLGQPPDPLARAGGDHRAVLQRARHGGFGHAGEPGDVRHLQVGRRLRDPAAGSVHVSSLRHNRDRDQVAAQWTGNLHGECPAATGSGRRYRRPAGPLRRRAAVAFGWPMRKAAGMSACSGSGPQGPAEAGPG